MGARRVGDRDVGLSNKMGAGEPQEEMGHGGVARYRHEHHLMGRTARHAAEGVHPLFQGLAHHALQFITALGGSAVVDPG